MSTIITVKRESSGFGKYVGLILVCVSDSMGAVVGRSVGKIRIPGNISPRTLEGFTAFFAVTMFSVWLGKGEVVTMDVLGVAVVSGIEAGTEGIDNIILPILGGIIWL
ncbi:hypothetical protein TrLO_g4455 [Triparma laevis f. longispina]|uniref:dolichol kinase n=1 Tax=Triparma laevis f. longispina TaxID=1714387 RepID=A0A9W7FRF3_9STRA|nr:hypothetical protein TrLO_g4455 [Triparma laevis f. longispina]